MASVRGEDGVRGEWDGFGEDGAGDGGEVFFFERGDEAWGQRRSRGGRNDRRVLRFA